MSQITELQKNLFENALRWFATEFRSRLLSPVEIQFPNFQLPAEIRRIQKLTDDLLREIGSWPGSPLSMAWFEQKLRKDTDSSKLLKRVIYLYRRERAAYVEGLT